MEDLETIQRIVQKAVAENDWNKMVELLKEYFNNFDDSELALKLLGKLVKIHPILDCYVYIVKSSCEYGYSIESYGVNNLDGSKTVVKNGLSCFFDPFDQKITSFTIFCNGRKVQSYDEQMFSNRTEYFINGMFIGYEPNTQFTTQVENMCKKIDINGDYKPVSGDYNPVSGDYNPVSGDYNPVSEVLKSPEVGFFMFTREP